MDAVRQKHLLLFVSEMLTGTLDLHGKRRQLTALRGKLRDGMIRGRRAVQAAKLEMERLVGELKTDEEEELSARMYGKDRDVTAPSDETAPGMIRDRMDTVESTKAGAITMGYSGGEFERRSSKFGEFIVTQRKPIVVKFLLDTQRLVFLAPFSVEILKLLNNIVPCLFKLYRKQN